MKIYRTQHKYKTKMRRCSRNQTATLDPRQSRQSSGCSSLFLFACLQGPFSLLLCTPFGAFCSLCYFRGHFLLFSAKEGFPPLRNCSWQLLTSTAVQSLLCYEEGAEATQQRFSRPSQRTCLGAGMQRGTEITKRPPSSLSAYGLATSAQLSRQVVVGYRRGLYLPIDL